MICIRSLSLFLHYSFEKLPGSIIAFKIPLVSLLKHKETSISNTSRTTYVAFGHFFNSIPFRQIFIIILRFFHEDIFQEGRYHFNP